MTNKSYAITNNIGTLEEKSMFSCGYTTDPELPKYAHEFCIPYYSCFLVLDGYGSFQDNNGLHAQLSRGIFVQRFPNLSHLITVDPNRHWESFFISLDQCCYDSLVNLGIISPQEPIKKCHITKELLVQFDELSYEIQHNSENNKFVLMQKLQKCIYDILTQTSETPSFSSITAKAKEILQCNYSIAYTEKDICELLCIGQESFRKLFKKEVGVSPMSYRNHQRMMAAKKQLATHDTIAEIAYSLGYSDSFTFSKQFKRHWGVSPNTYRKNLLSD